MSFNRFIYYCLVCGGWAALIAWALSWRLAPESGEHGLARAAVRGLFLGAWVALGLSVIDSLWNSGGRFNAESAVRVAAAVVGGLAAGLLGGLLGQFLSLTNEYLLVVGWVLVGTLIGASIGLYDLLARMLSRQELRGALRKMINGVIGGAVGGLFGGFAYILLNIGLTLAFAGKTGLWSPSAVGFVILGLCIGLMIGLAQVILKDAWIRVEAGFRPGRELILTKPVTTVGKAESCDLGLFGGRGVEKLHARIVMQGNEYYVGDNQTPGGTFVNEQRVQGFVRLRAGDRIRLGDCVLLFRERARR